jgi:hypothetical protein
VVVVLALGAATALRSRPLDLWWNTEPERLTALRTLEASLRTERGAIVVSDAPPLRVLELAYRVPPDASLRLGAGAAGGIASDEWPRVVVVAPSDDLQASSRAAAARAGTTLLPSDDALAWRAAGAAR